MTRTRNVPQRSCVACRQVREKPQLVRVVRTPAGEVRVDVTGKLAGRGAYVCRDEHCLDQAAKQRKLERALGVPVGDDVVRAVRAILKADVGEKLPGGKRTADAGL